MTDFSTRLRNAQHALAAHKHDAVIVGPSSDLNYLLGYDALPLERLTLLIVPMVGEVNLIVPELERERAQAFGCDRYASVVTYTETDNPIVLAASLLNEANTIAVQQHLFSGFTLALQQQLPSCQFVTATPVLAPLRLTKTSGEIELLRAAAKAIDSVHAKVADWLRPGLTEAVVGRHISEAILDTHDRVNFVIVASGANGASPHHELSDRVLVEGDTVVVDIGGTRDGYCSDETRNYVIGTPPNDYREVHDTVLRAHAAAVATVRPGVSTHSVDAAARQVIIDAGYGRYFIHRTGHGIGLDAHEEPWIVAGNDTLLTAGMAFSIEPGIYLPGRFGVRIEDIVAVTDTGVDVLNEAPRTLISVS
ncbi:MAG: Xaa-Pro peptidase family protein [Nitriliruptoraceae bacterium]